MCCILCPGGPVDNDPRPSGHEFKTDLCGACCSDPCCCLCQLYNPCCTQWYLRRKALNYDMSKYECCQGYFKNTMCCCCCENNCRSCTDCCPTCCLCCEALFCNCCALNSTRFYVMDSRNLQSDPCDRKLIRCNNMIQCCSCLCNILACFIPACQDAAWLTSCLANITYCSLSGCMAAQVSYELSGTGPTRQTMK